MSALTPTEFAAYVRRIRTAEAALGSPELALSPAERTYRRKALKAVVTSRPLAAGAVVQAADVVLLRAPLPEVGEVLRRPEEVVGRRLARAVEGGRPLCPEDLA